MTGSALYRMWHLRAADGTAIDIAPVGNLHSNISSVLETAVLAGHGLAWLPAYLCCDALRSGRLVTVLDDYMAPPYAIRALYPHNRHLSAKVRAFVDFLAARFGREPYWEKGSRVPEEHPEGQSALPAFQSA
jgi:DNA-binding transcriptional LysR family regulator